MLCHIASLPITLPITLEPRLGNEIWSTSWSTHHLSYRLVDMELSMLLETISTHMMYSLIDWLQVWQRWNGWKLVLDAGTTLDRCSRPCASHMQNEQERLKILIGCMWVFDTTSLFGLEKEIPVRGAHSWISLPFSIILDLTWQLSMDSWEKGHCKSATRSTSYLHMFMGFMGGGVEHCCLFCHRLLDVLFI